MRPVTAQTMPLPQRMAVWLTYAGTLYLLGLCLINTRVMPLQNAAIIVAESLVVLCAVPVLLLRPNLGSLLVTLCVSINFLLLAALRQSTDFKPLRDLLLPVLFVWLGYVAGSRSVAERTLRNVAWIATTLGLIEFMFPGIYSSVIDTIAFYASRGYTNPFALQVLQERPEGIGRSLFPFLGPRRMSSIFLEPVALGNFAVLTAAWALAKPREAWRQSAGLMIPSFAMIVMADARFGSMAILLMLVARTAGFHRFRAFYPWLPFAAMLLLMAVGWTEGPRLVGDNFLGRLQLSGNNLLDMPWSAWLGFPAQVSFDAGYGYIIQRTGILICAFLWIVFARLPLKDEQALRFHFNVTLYITLILAISGSSLFALKTGAMLWFLLGSVIAHRGAIERLAFSAWLRRPRAWLPT